MPIYTWKNKKTGEIVEVIRTFENYEVPPETPEDGDWERVIGVPMLIRGPSWGKKGNLI